MKKTVLDVGNCRPDHASIVACLRSAFDVEVRCAADAEETFHALRAKPADLVLVNRELDADGSCGIEVIRRIKSDPSLGCIPVMLVSNYSEYQDAAVSVGAERGFGKAALREPETVRLLARVLGPSNGATPT